MRRRDVVLACVTLLVFALWLSPFASTEAGLRITYLGRQLSWNASSPESMPLSFVLHRAGSDDVPGDADDHALRRAFRSWEHAAGAAIAFQERGGSDRDRVDWYEDDLHTIYFDEWNETGFFPGRSGIVALTPVQFLLTPDPATGDLPILDADIIFNGEDHAFSTNLTPGTFDIEGVAAHEIGHFLGFDHSAVGGSTMFPYVAHAHSEQRALEPDDVCIARGAYPAAARSATGVLSGRTMRITGEPISGAHVVALDEHGSVVTATLAQGSGRFELELPVGTYSLYAEPLDQPVTGGNVSSTFSIQTDFATTFLGGVERPSTLTVSAGLTNEIGDFVLGFPHAANLRRSLVGTPLVAERGARAVLIQIEGDGLETGLELRVTGAGVSYDGPTHIGNGLVERTLSIDEQAERGLRSVVVVDPWDRCAAYTGLLEIRDPAPSLSWVSPSHGPQAGGQRVQLHGTWMTAGSRVLWNEVEVETVHVTDDVLEIVTPPGDLGAVDLAVLRDDGREARLIAGYHYATVPTIETVFPDVVQSIGGSEVTLTGGPFTPGVVVLVGALPATNVQVLDSRTLRFHMPQLAAGLYDIEVDAPLAGSAQLALGIRTANALDPELSSVSRGSVSAGGGETVQLVGAHFDVGTTIVFGANRDTGRGGVQAANVEFVASDVVIVTTPPSPSGPRTVLVRTARGQVTWSRTDLVFGAPVEVGQRFYGDLEHDDEDVLAVPLLEGSEVRFRVRAPSRSGLLPELTFEDGEGRILGTTNRTHATYDPSRARGAGSSHVDLTIPDLPRTDVYWVRLRGEEGSAGTYVVRVESRALRSAQRVSFTRREPLSIGLETAWIRWHAVAGSDVSLTVRTRDGEPLAIETLVGPLGSIVDGGESEVLRFSNDRSRLTVRSLGLEALGTYALGVRTASGAPDALIGTLTIRPPRVHGRTSELR